MSITTINPTTGEPLATYDAHDDAALDELLSRGHDAARAWGRTSLVERLATVARLAVVLRSHAADAARLVSTEMGKPLSEAVAEVEKSAGTADYYAQHTHELLADRAVPVDGAEAWVAHEPMGLLLAVMPWNFPVWQAMRFVLPALSAGNGVLLKHSPNVSGSALLLERLALEAGVPQDVFAVALVEEERVPDVMERVILDDRIAGVTLTGSNRAGSAVGAAAGRAVKPSVLELGGSDAFVVLADADVQTAARTAVRARYLNAGQSCVCAKRFVVEAPIADEFVEAFTAGTRELVVGDPLAQGTQMGPLARADLRDIVESQVRRSAEAGATVLHGGEPLDGKGYFFAPTVLADVRPGMAAFDEETFGPVAAITVAADRDDAARLADHPQFGLGLSVWSGDRAKALELAGRVTTGAVFINAMVASDPRVPFGGTKRSGYGRELAADGLLSFVNTRTYWSA